MLGCGGLRWPNASADSDFWLAHMVDKPILRDLQAVCARQVALEVGAHAPLVVKPVLALMLERCGAAAYQGSLLFGDSPLLLLLLLLLLNSVYSDGSRRLR